MTEENQAPRIIECATEDEAKAEIHRRPGLDIGIDILVVKPRVTRPGLVINPSEEREETIIVLSGSSGPQSKFKKALAEHGWPRQIPHSWLGCVAVSVPPWSGSYEQVIGDLTVLFPSHVLS